ncbi:TonB-dependent receptor [Formosa sp. PL04]|uniref:SusC/RagA family TonB-linked outer membrane protein n=1 Tax=Formosa sp. PL04 TaxID=3081755 RepID=UPI002981EE7A|nr:TonB-dependent receptor [Formosa sp. PL04]MDW5287239.1 TonB-dependent receptor [Formosa sp. PL04]
MIKLKLAIVTLVMIFTQIGFSQTNTVSGIVSDESGMPIPGVSVILAESQKGTSTDFDGKYTIENLNSTDQLLFSYIGMTSQTITVGGQATINVTLVESLEALDEIVVVGYGVTTRRKVTGAISTVEADVIMRTPVVSVDQALQGNAAGVTVTNAGSPGTNPQVQIRGLKTFGNSQPLFVVDGIITGGINEINPNDIASMDVLKDASTAAIYGSRASNGVVMITTKKGKPGKTKVTVDTYISSQAKPETLDLLNSDQFAQFTSETFGQPNRYTVDPASTQLNTDWQDQVFRSAIMESVNVGASGGSEDAIFNISAGYLDQEGLIVSTGFQRSTLRANSEFKLGNRFKIGQTLSVADSDKQNEQEAGDRTLVEHMIKSLPYTPVYDSANLGGYGGPNTTLDNGSDAENAVRIQQLQTNETEELKILGSIYASYDIVEGLNFRLQYGFDRSTTANNIFRPSFNEGVNNRPAAYVQQGTNTFSSDNISGAFTYSKTFNEAHNLDVLFVAEEFKSTARNTDAQNSNPITDAIPLVQGTAQVNNTLYEYALLSYIGRINYEYMGKYLLAASLRYDGSSRFGSNNRWGTFPAVSAGWIISEESFLKESNSVSNLKLRASWGVTGNDGSNDYVYSSGLVNGFNYTGLSYNDGWSNYGASNPDLKWEQSTQTNIGLDLGFFNNALSISLEYYNINSEDIIVPIPNVASDGLTEGFTQRNGATATTDGFEASIGYNHNKGGNFSWGASMNLGTSKNRVTDLGDLDFIESSTFEGENLQRITLDESLYYFYGYQTDGLFQIGDDTSTQPNAGPGDIRFVDQNNDGTIDGDDNVKIGDPLPNFTYGLNLTANYKQFDALIFFTGVSGNDIYNTTLYDLEGMTRLFNSGTAVLDRWTPENTGATVPRFTADHSDNVNRSDRFVEDGAYTKLRNVTVGYSLSDQALSSIAKGSFTKLRVYLSGQNLITITNYSGYDPEIGGSTVSPNQLSGAAGIGIDRGNYPQPKSIILGLQLGF